MTAISNYITNDFKAIDSQDNISTIQDVFADSPFSYFPVVEKNVYIGSLAFDDLVTFDPNKKIKDYRYVLEPFFVKTNMIGLEIFTVFGKNQTNISPVLDEKNQYIGYLELKDVLPLFYETPFLKETGAIVVVKKSFREYAMSQITQIIESNNGKLLGLFISNLDDETIEVTVKISLGNLNNIIQTFRRYNYEIVSKHNQDNYINSLKERSDYLNKYLNI